MIIFSENESISKNFVERKKMSRRKNNSKFQEFKMLIYFVILFITLPHISCNIWDNIFSNLSSPENSIPEEFCVELFDKKNENLKLGEIWVSTMNNKMKFVLYNTIEEIDILNQINNIKNSSPGLLSGKDLINLLKNFTTSDNNKNIPENFLNFDNSSKINEFISIIIDFNKDSSISFLSEDFCQIQKNKNLNRLGVKLILVSYDLFTYFEENSENDIIVYDDYIFTNLPMNYKHDFNNSVSDKRIKIFLPLFQVLIKENYKKEIESLKNNIDSIKNSTKKSGHLVDSKALIVFRVNKQTQKLQEINFKYEDVKYYSMLTRVKTFNSIDDKIFDPIEIKEDGVICEILKEGDKKEKTVVQFVLENVLKMKNI